MASVNKNFRGHRLARTGVNVLALQAGLLMAGAACGAEPGGSPDMGPFDPGKPVFQATIENGTLRITGTRSGDDLTLRLKADDPAILEVDADSDGAAEFSFDRSRFDSILVLAGNGDDVVTIDDSNGAFTDTEETTLDGENGDDTLIGGAGAETFLGGRGNDTVDGNQGADSALLGRGDDTFIWDPGDGSDLVEGERGDDVMVFNGAGASEQFDLSAVGPRLRFFRTQGNIVMDLDGVERIDLNALGGTDDVVVNDLAGTAVSQVNIDLAGALDGADGDNQADSVTVQGTADADAIVIAPVEGAVAISGLAATVRILHPEAAIDSLIVNGLGGADEITPDAGVAALVNLIINED